MRLDVYLVNNQFFASREQAKVNIAKGNVLVNGARAKKPSQEVHANDKIEVSGDNVVKYVSRGGLKLEKALREFGIDCKGLLALDVGSSTGGFTHCLLLHGAKKVYAVDVGTQQLDESLRNHSQVVSIENKNIKDLSTEEVDGNSFNLVVADLSFVSLTKVIRYFIPFLDPTGVIIALIKPQFEVGLSAIGKNGIVKNPRHHITAIKNVVDEAVKHELFANKLISSPLIERFKNIEYLVLFGRVQSGFVDFAKVIDEAFASQAGS